MSSCVTVHDSVSVSIIVSEILPFENFPLNVCPCHKVGQGHPPFGLPRCQLCSIYLTSQPGSGR